MLALVIIFLITPIIAATIVWLYRLVSNWRSAKYVVIGRQNTNTRMTLTTQQGYISLFSASREEIDLVRVRSTKIPWGW